MAEFNGTPDGDTIRGTANGDTFNMQDGGNDRCLGKDENDFFFFGASFNGFETGTEHDDVNGGDGYDTIFLAGNYATTILLNDSVVRGVEEISLQGSQASLPRTYNLGISGNLNGTFAVQFFINGSDLTKDDTLIINEQFSNALFLINTGEASATIRGADKYSMTVVSTGGNKIEATAGDRKDYFNWNATPGSSGGPPEFNTKSKYDGGLGQDTLALTGDLSAGVTFRATTITNIETVRLGGGGFSYDLKLNDANIASGATLVISGSSVSAFGTFFNLDASREKDGSLDVTGGFRGGIYKTGAGDDIIRLGAGGLNLVEPGRGIDTVIGSSATDIIDIKGYFAASDQINGGSGINDEIIFNGIYSGPVVFTATTVTNVDRLTFMEGHSYNFRLNAATVGAGQTLTLNGVPLGASDQVILDGSSTAGVLVFKGGAGRDIFKGGAGADDFYSSGGADRYTLGAGSNDLYYTGPASESSGLGHDTVFGWDGTRDFLDVAGFPSVTQVTTGALSKANFDADIASALGTASAMAFTPDSGALAGHQYLVIDKNGVAGYQAGGDLVIEFVGALQWGTFNFFEEG